LSDDALIAAVAKNAAADTRLCRGIAKLVKALDFDSSIPRFESLFPCHLLKQQMKYRQAAKSGDPGLAAFQTGFHTQNDPGIPWRSRT
jgi:hypothetical protein